MTGLKYPVVFAAWCVAAQSLFADEHSFSRFFLPPKDFVGENANAAKSLFDSAAQAAKQHEASRAYQLAYEALHADADFTAGRSSQQASRTED